MIITKEKVIEFGAWLTGHDEETVAELLDDYNHYKEREVSVPAETLAIPKIADRAIKFLYEVLGTCPADNCDYEKIDCEKLCDTEGRKIDDCSKCWKDYFADDSNFTA